MASYLDSLIASLPSYPYRGLESLWSHVERQRQDNPTEKRSEYALFTGVDSKSFHHDFEPSQEKLTSYLLDSYFPQLQTILIKIGISGEDELGHLHLNLTSICLSS